MSPNVESPAMAVIRDRLTTVLSVDYPGAVADAPTPLGADGIAARLPSGHYVTIDDAAMLSADEWGWADGTQATYAVNLIEATGDYLDPEADPGNMATLAGWPVLVPEGASAVVAAALVLDAIIKAETLDEALTGAAFVTVMRRAAS